MTSASPAEPTRRVAIAQDPPEESPRWVLLRALFDSPVTILLEGEIPSDVAAVGLPLPNPLLLVHPSLRGVGPGSRVGWGGRLRRVPPR